MAAPSALTARLTREDGAPMLIQQWNGTPQELARLRQAVERNCACAQSPQAPGPTCPAHALLTRQATLDHLLFVYRTRTRFLAREVQPD